MNSTVRKQFVLPDWHLSSLPTGQVKDVVDALGKMIARGEYPSGERIPMEPNLAEQFDVSRTVVREAVKVLSGKGLIRTARRYGSSVCPFDEWNLLDPDVIGWHEPNNPVGLRIFSESTQMRSIFEPEAAALAAERAVKEQRLTILAAARAVDPETDGIEGMLAADFVFHSTILEASNNIMLAQLRGLLLSLLKFSYRMFGDEMPDGIGLRQAHTDVADAIAVGDSESARSLMRSMLDSNVLVDKIKRRA